ncbi:hypothetical protein PR048_003547 [Dryococelus australis]|uniref:Uncharacterized protein n=1 Tax=Dryococelus australis TaxID=614101 RepID=A0ABQ9INF4_9NEOP|nr:hypothetical protein PR048_003547 [Dryococelus australis]
MRLERASQKQSSDTRKTPYDRVEAAPGTSLSSHLPRGHGDAVVRLPASSHLNSPPPPGDFRTWESCLTMPLIGGFSLGPPVSPALAFRRCFILASLRPRQL